MNGATAEGERHWVLLLYETFILRDLIGYVGPGSLLIMGLLVEIGKTAVLRAMTSSWPRVAVLVAASYVAAVGLRILGTVVPLCVFHGTRGVFGRPRILRPDRQENSWYRLERLFWREDEDRLRRAYEQLDEKYLHRALEREGVFLHLTGHMGMVCLVLSAVALFNGISDLSCIPRCVIAVDLTGHILVLFVAVLCPWCNGISNLSYVSGWFIVVGFLLASIAFFLGHYRHAHQEELLSLLVRRRALWPRRSQRS